jgi:23S rRNA maturation-related 3'-5' exoribonuclease YhaM
MISINGKPERSTDWKDNLCVEDEQRLNTLLDSIKRHRCAYKASENVQVAQVWCAMIEFMKMADKLDQRVAYIERTLDRLFRGHSEEKAALLKDLTKF